MFRDEKNNNRWSIRFLEADKHWCVIAPIGVVIKRFINFEQATDYLRDLSGSNGSCFTKRTRKPK